MVFKTNSGWIFERELWYAYQEWEVTISDLKRFSLRRLVQNAILSINFAYRPGVI